MYSKDGRCSGRRQVGCPGRGGGCRMRWVTWENVGALQWVGDPKEVDSMEGVNGLREDG